MADYYVITTTTGQTKLANAIATQTPLPLTTFVVGNSNGAYYEPTAGQSALVNQVWSGAVNRVYTHPNNPTWIVVEAIIPASAGGFDIREAGVKDNTGALIAIGKYPLTNKPAPGSGSEKDLYVRLIMQVTNAASVSQTIDPSLVMATQEYVDRKNVREACRVATTANIALSGLQTIDGVTVVANDRVLVKNQTTGSQNGIYVAGAGAWTRALDADNALEVTDTMIVPVREGTANGDSIQMLTTNAPITVGTTALTFRPVCGPLISSVQEQAGTGLIAKTAAGTAATRSIVAPAAGLTVTNGNGVSGNPTLALANDLAALEGLAGTGMPARTAADTWVQRTVAGTAGRVSVTNGDGVSGNPTIDLVASGVTAGTWNQVTVDAYGRVTSGATQLASETVAGFVELATAAETTTGTDSTRAVHPAGLKVELDKKAPLVSPALTGTPTAPTAAVGTATTQLATTAFVANQAGVSSPLMDGTATVGTSTRFARDDHRHPTDTTRQPLDATLTALAGVTTAADKLIYATGVDTFSSATLTPFARQILDDADAATARATLGIAGTVVQSVAAYNGTYNNFTATIPWDNTIPQITEGTEILSATITPTSSNHIIEVEVQVQVAWASYSAVLALFKGGAANAVQATAEYVVASHYPKVVTLLWRGTAGQTAPMVFSCRCGNSNGVVIYINGANTEAKFGGVGGSWMRIREYAV